MTAGAQHGITGDTFGIDLPETVMPEQDLTQEKNMAKFSKSTEFKKLKEYLEARITFFQTQLPDGRPLLSDTVTEKDWVVANLVIGEFKAVINAYEQAAQAVEEDHVRRA